MLGSCIVPRFLPIVFRNKEGGNNIGELDFVKYIFFPSAVFFMFKSEICVFCHTFYGKKTFAIQGVF
jgi:hypothetical protein